MGSSDNDRPSRRALLAGAAAGAAVVGLEAAGRPQAAHAAAGSPVTMGVINESADATRIYSPQFPSYTTSVLFNGAYYAMAGGTSLDDAIGVSGYASGANGIGVRGATDGHSSTIGVFGESDPEGIAVKAYTKNGIAVYAEANGGHALQVHGRAVFDRSGRATFKPGQASKTIANRYVGGGALVLATIQGDIANTWVRGVSLNVAQEKFVIRLNRPAPKKLVVGWFIVN